MLGLTIAWRLAQAGKQVHIREAAQNLGGLASAWTLRCSDGQQVRWDRHYHVTLLSDLRTRNLLTELNLEQDMVWNRSLTGFYTDGRHISMSSSLDFLRFPALNLIDKVRLGLTIIAASRIPDWTQMETKKVEDWLRSWSGKRTFEKIWLPLLKAKLGDSYTRTSAAFIWATINRLYAARRSGLKHELFGYLRGGYGRMLDVFEKNLAQKGVSIRCGSPVESIRRTTNGQLQATYESGQHELFDRVITTMPSPLAAKLCPQLSDREKSQHRSVEYQGIICASVLLEKPLTKYYVTNITDPAPFTGVIDMSALVDRKEFGGKTLVYLPKYVTPNDPLFLATDEQIRESFLSALEKMYNGFRKSNILAFEVSRVRQVFPIPVLNYSKTVPPIKTSIPGLYIVNSSHIMNGTLNVNETISLAERAAMEFMKERLASPVKLEALTV